ncbi:hypothetical protein B0H11DRAFT_1923558 [Mycena galericulata]|nr:hypothetical protein B0H11DRAFT_1923558 [Mycena galericulata]
MLPMTKFKLVLLNILGAVDVMTEAAEVLNLEEKKVLAEEVVADRIHSVTVQEAARKLLGNRDYTLRAFILDTEDARDARIQKVQVGTAEIECIRVLGIQNKSEHFYGLIDKGFNKETLRRALDVMGLNRWVAYPPILTNSGLHEFH